jgi:hypothetical protein
MEFQVQRNEFQARRNKFQARRNKIKIERNKIQIGVPSADRGFSMGYRRFSRPPLISADLRPESIGAQGPIDAHAGIQKIRT